ncbi:MAG: hypothetical protein HWQ41_01720 [Nostoc sp. NOS(2021)]|uniref:hypothetical protein n=1 Tax=Nostoc sp. NOS(2021) TaxID=2815407 RepID=UPI0025FD90FA|nr:hypothetical protein [Nostoc sp. NOS(2021)]MBN3894049.1 hypothetical protein [Nostoc sp. NOS(2021)]
MRATPTQVRVQSHELPPIADGETAQWFALHPIGYRLNPSDSSKQFRLWGLTINNSKFKIQNSNILDIFRLLFKPRLKLIGGGVTPTPR